MPPRNAPITDLAIPSTCWPRQEDFDYATPACDALMERFWPLDATAGFARNGLSILPPIVGLILGVPIVAREIELRTTELAWSLALHRSRWLLSRLLPMVAIALAGFVVLGLLGWWLFKALEVGRESPDLNEVASQGPTLVARGLMALGVAVLLGVIIGRTMPALLVAALAVLAWGIFAVPTIQGSMLPQYAVWQSQGDPGWRDGVSPIAYVDGGTFDPMQPGIDGEPGARIDDERLQALLPQACGPVPESHEESPKNMAYFQCDQRFYDERQWSRVVPASAYGHFQLVDTILSLAIGGAALVLTFPIVARRRSG